MSGAQVGARLLNFVLIASVARGLGSEGAGGYATAVSIALVFLLLTDLGLSPRLIREASARPDSALRLYQETLGLKLMLVPLGLLAIGLAGTFLPYPAEVRQLVLLIGLAALLQSIGQANEALLRSREAMSWEALGNLLQSGITTGLAITFLAGGLSLIWVGVARVVGAAANLLVSAWVLRDDFRPRLPRSSTWSELRNALPYAATASMNLAYGQIDILLISLIAPQTLVGEYALVSRIVLVAGTFASTGAAALLPSMARTFATGSWSLFRNRAGQYLGLAALVGAISSGVLALTGETLLGFAYGIEFASLSEPFAFASGYVLLRFLSATLGMELTAADRQSTRARCVLIGLAATVVLVGIGVPTLGVVGAIGALVGSEAILAICLMVSGRRFFGGEDPRAEMPSG